MDSLSVGVGWACPPVEVKFDVNTCISSFSIGVSPCTHSMIWSVRWMASMHICPKCVGIWISMDRVLGFPRMRSLSGVVCMFADQGVHWFM